MILSYALIVFCSIFPLFFSFPFRINLFLAWEGAYRLYLGQVPFKDFGMPMGFGFWILPAIFFKLFGPTVYTLLKVQVLINFISLISFQSILRLLKIRPVVIFFSILVFCLSYTLINFWPWYNHTVFVFQLVGINFLVMFMLKERSRWHYFYLFLSAFFTVLAFFTKQDGGGLAIVFSLALLLYHLIKERKYLDIVWYGLMVASVVALFVLPFLNHGFLYWFNYGQFPHYSRVDLFDFLNELFGASPWIKFYMFFVVIGIFYQLKNWRAFWNDKPAFLMSLITLGVLVQALIIQVTSYTPINGNIYFHSFAFAFILSLNFSHIKLEKIYLFIIAGLVITFWWSGVFWNRFLGNMVRGMLPAKELPEDVISKNTFIVTDTVKMDRADWVVSDLKSFGKVKLPKETIAGIKRLEPFFMTSPQDVRVLNMSELTPLAYEFGYRLPSDQPLWFHKGVAIFQKEVDMFCHKINQKEYDIILFEIIPDLNNFYPQEVYDCIGKNYKMHDRFLAPRLNEDSYIEVYRVE